MNRKRRPTGPKTRYRVTPVEPPAPERMRSADYIEAPAPDAPMYAVPHDPSLPDLAREHWLAGRWDALQRVEGDALLHHPDRAALVALRAAGAIQLGDRHAARVLGRQALEWGCSRQALAGLLVAATRHTLGRASFLARRDQKAAGHFEAAVSEARLASEARRHAMARHDKVVADLKRAVGESRQLRQAGSQVASLKAPTWLIALADRCLGGEDPHDAIDHCLRHDLQLADDRVHFMILLAERLQARGDRMTALHFLNVARADAVSAEPELRADLMRRLVALNAAPNAVDVALEAALSSAVTDQDKAAANAVRAAFDRMRNAVQAHEEHGHELLLQYLHAHGEALRRKAPGRPLVLIEVGTTREDVPGQGSTRKLAEYCLKHGMHFITVDMDPHNSRMATETFAKLGAPFEAVTMKGEDYLRERTGPIDLVFLDAYDYDHGMHSALRQSRYERFLGARIDEQACHQMHLDCAQSLVSKLWEHGVICVDDTWRIGEGWAAKGTTAVPYLLEHGYALLDERNKAVLMARPE